ncbi:MAG TPA: universal stress protein [Dehalococcoidia bacterium]|nr:universal stress protein [Dehalococcoidia bacterium]
MYQRILVPLDGSATAEQALPYARLLSTGFKASIELLRVIDGPAVGPVDLEHDAVINQLAESARAQAGEYLANVAGSLRAGGLEVVTSILEGDPASIIVTESEKAPGTLIAISTHGRSGITRWVMGSVSDKVLHATRAPMLIVRCAEAAPSPGINFSGIIVPLDGSQLAEQVLAPAVAVAKALGLKTTLLRVTPSAGDYFRYMDYPPADYEDLSKEVDDDAVRYLDNINRRIKLEGVAQTEERLIHGNAAFAITDFVKEIPNSLVAMTTHGRSGIGRWVMGSVADRVVRHSGGPVLVVRAEETAPAAG